MFNNLILQNTVRILNTNLKKIDMKTPHVLHMR
jgi:hypothetical protein